MTPQFLTRLRRIGEKLRLRLRFAGWMLRYEDTLQRSVCRISFAQNGEDLIVGNLFQQLNIARPRYLDIGAHHPYLLSNTALFYGLGARGMNIEPDPHLHASFVRHRPGDINLNIGVAAAAGTLTFYQMQERSLSTFSADTARRLAQDGHTLIEREIPVPVRPISQILADHGFRPDFLTIDAEGMDLEILRGYNFVRDRPAVICAETIGFSSHAKDLELPAFLLSRGYRVHADTRINTIFVDDALPASL